MRYRFSILLFGLTVPGCGTVGYALPEHDLRLAPSGDTLYVLARSDYCARNFCAMIGGDVTREEARHAAEGAIGRVRGCYTVRHVMVCAENDPVCLAHQFSILSFVLTVPGCGTAGAALPEHDLRLASAGDTLFVLARSHSVARSFCAMIGGDVAREEARHAAEGAVGAVSGCHTVRHVIVCAENDLACVTHEERHREEWSQR